MAIFLEPLRIYSQKSILRRFPNMVAIKLFFNIDDLNWNMSRLQINYVSNKSSLKKYRTSYKFNHHITPTNRKKNTRRLNDLWFITLMWWKQKCIGQIQFTLLWFPLDNRQNMETIWALFYVIIGVSMENWFCFHLKPFFSFLTVLKIFFG